MKQNQGKEKKKTTNPLWKRLALLVVVIAAYMAINYFFPGLLSSQEDPGQSDINITDPEEKPGKDDPQKPGKDDPQKPGKDDPEPAAIDKNGFYTTKEDVALYIHTYGRLPGNFITKATAEGMGWSGGGLDKYQKNACIGGDRFGNYEGLLPKGHTYTECDIDTMGAKARGVKRIVFSEYGRLIYYTDDHYETFELLYGEE